VIAGAGGDDPARPFLFAEVGDLVVGAAQLEAENRLQVLALEQHLVAEPPRQPRCPFQRRFAGDVVDAAGEDVVQQLGQQRATAGHKRGHVISVSHMTGTPAAVASRSRA